LALPCAPYKHYFCFNSSGSLAKLTALPRCRAAASRHRGLFEETVPVLHYPRLANERALAFVYFAPSSALCRS
jgi:hypothetical protein